MRRWLGRIASMNRGLLFLLTAFAALVITLLVLNFTATTEKLERLLPRQYAVGDAQFERVMTEMLGPGVVGGNRIELLRNGDEIFPAMLAAIRSAERSITFESFVFVTGQISNEFIHAFAERARAGVKVHVIIDWAGSDRMDTASAQLLRDAGVEVVRFNPLSLRNLARLNNRTHRKLLVVDGRVGFTGGVGIQDEWLGHGEDSDHWRDDHFQVEGPAVAQLQSAFMDHWVSFGKSVLSDDAYFPALAPVSEIRAHVFKSTPRGGNASLRLMYLLALTAAGRTISLSSSYFVPDDLLVKTLIAAVERGVKVRIIVPGQYMDQASVRRASRESWGPLLEAGVEIYEYQPTMYHCKVMTVDEQWVSVGSTNFDDRSLMFNDEANLNVYDAGFAKRIDASFAEDLKHSQRVTLAAWQARSWTERVKEWVAELLHSQL